MALGVLRGMVRNDNEDDENITMVIKPFLSLTVMCGMEIFMVPIV